MSVMKAYYGTILDLAILEERADRLTVQAGDTRITFVNSSDTVDGRPPFYHFAFNIPENKILKALEWQKARTPMLPSPSAIALLDFLPRWSTTVTGMRTRSSSSIPQAPSSSTSRGTF